MTVEPVVDPSQDNVFCHRGTGCDVIMDPLEIIKPPVPSPLFLISERIHHHFTWPELSSYTDVCCTKVTPDGRLKSWAKTACPIKPEFGKVAADSQEKYSMKRQEWFKRPYREMDMRECSGPQLLF